MTAATARQGAALMVSAAPSLHVSGRYTEEYARTRGDLGKQTPAHTLGRAAQ